MSKFYIEKVVKREVRATSHADGDCPNHAVQVMALWEAPLLPNPKLYSQ